jgi:transposase-like protein
MGRGASRSMAVWKRRVAEQRRSRLTVAEFCRREGVSPASFYAWRKRLQKPEAAAGGEPLFVALQMPEAPHWPDGLQIELPGGAVVRLPAEAPAALVTTAIRAAMNDGSGGEGRSC